MHKNQQTLWRFTLVIFFLSLSAQGLETAYVSFDHPAGWKCELSQGVWICQNTVEPDRKESVVLSIATVASEWDTLDNYVKYLSTPKTLKDDGGKSIRSKVTYVRKRNINGVTWVDSLQKDSELPGFWARYVATVHNKLAILITYIVSNDHYSKLAPQFEKMISSLKPRADFDLNVASKQGDGPIPGSTKLGPLTKSILTDRLNVRKSTDEDVDEEEPTGNWGLVILGLIAGAVVLGWFFRRRRMAAQKKNRDDSDREAS